MTSDPTRLLDDPQASAALRDDLASAVNVEVEGLDLAAGLGALRAAPAGASAPAGTSLLTKLGVGAVLAGGAVALWLGWGDPSPRPSAPEVVATAAEPASGAATQQGAVAQDGAAGPAVVKPSLGPEPELAPAEPELAPAEPELAPAEPPTAIEPSSPSPAGHGHDKRSQRHDDRPDRSAASPAVDDVLREAKLVARARSKLARDPAAALALTEEAERDFPKGQLVEERRAIAIAALVALGRIDEAQRRSVPFLAEFGRGAHAAAVRRALADAASDGKPGTDPPSDH